MKFLTLLTSVYNSKKKPQIPNIAAKEAVYIWLSVLLGFKESSANDDTPLDTEMITGLRNQHNLHLHSSTGTWFSNIYP